MAPNMHAAQHANSLGYGPMYTYGYTFQSAAHESFDYESTLMIHDRKKGHGPVRRYTGVSAEHYIQSVSLSRSSPKSSSRSKRHGQSCKSVGFESSRDESFEVENIADLPVDEIWYTQDEYISIKVRNNRIARGVKSGEFVEGDQQTARGLEHRQKDVFAQRRDNKAKALNAVIAEQDRQISVDANDPEAIANAYKAVSGKCQDVAFSIGISDAENSVNFSNFTLLSTLRDEGNEEEESDSVTSQQARQRKKKKGRKGMRGLVKKIRRRASM